MPRHWQKRLAAPCDPMVEIKEEAELTAASPSKRQRKRQSTGASSSFEKTQRRAYRHIGEDIFIRSKTNLSRPAEELLPEVKDIIHYCNSAARIEAGDIIWLSWNGASKRRTSIHYGSTALAVTPRGAYTLATAFENGEIEKGHIDMSLKQYLLRPDVQNAARFSYVMPPLGNFAVHPSGCAKAFAKERPAHWGEPWCCKGTRKEEDNHDRDKFLCQMTTQGPAVYLGGLKSCDQLLESDIHWMTYWAISEEEETGPQELTAWWSSSSGSHDWWKSWSWWSAEADSSWWRSNQGWQDDDAASLPPGGRTKWVSEDKSKSKSKRQRRRNRRRTLNLSRRNWVDDPAEACWTRAAIPFNLIPKRMFMAMEKVLMHDVAIRRIVSLHIFSLYVRISLVAKRRTSTSCCKLEKSCVHFLFSQYQIPNVGECIEHSSTALQEAY